jgi:hypothetical protein
MKKMKNLKFIILATLIVIIYSCKKEEIETPQYETPQYDTCNCGAITNDGITDDCYWLDVKNDCSSNIKRFCVPSDFWMTAYVGTNVCITGEESW